MAFHIQRSGAPPSETPAVQFDAEQRRNYHVADGRRVWHEVPPGYEFDENGRLHPTGETEAPDVVSGYSAPAESSTTSTETAIEYTGQRRPKREVTHGRTD